MIKALLKKTIKKFSKKKILVIGDIMLDQYTYGEVDRISPEAPVPILKKTHDKFAVGGAGNVACNLARLGANVMVCGVVGSDHYKDMIFSMFSDEKIDFKGVMVHKNRPTTVKHRFVSAANHQLLRLDTEEETLLGEEEKKEMLFYIKKIIPLIDGIIFSDYAKGLFSLEFTQEIINYAKKFSKPTFADIKPKNKEFFRGANIVAPNRKEALEMSGVDSVEIAGQKLLSYFGGSVIVTKSQEGMSAFLSGGKSIDIKTKKISVFDVSGAGDTVISVIALGTVSGLRLEDAAWLANCAGGIVVQKPGTSTVTPEELLSYLEKGNNIEDVDVVPKVWGYEKWLENNDRYCSKMFFLKKGYQCSLHYHKIKDEMFLVTKGHVRFELGDKVIFMQPGSFVRVLPKTPHRFRGMEDSEILEVSTHHSEEDSYRIEESRKVKDSEMEK